MNLSSFSKHILAKFLSKVYFGTLGNTSTIEAYLYRLSLRGATREGINLLSYFFGTEKCLFYPRSVRFEVTNCCNLKCPMCPQPTKMRRSRQLMDINLYKRVLDYCPQIEEVDLFNWGEPLLHPKLEEFIEYASAQKKYSRLVTNAVLLEEKRTKLLLAAGLKAIIFSLDNTGEKYQLIRGTSFERTLRNVMVFIERAREMPYPVYIGINMTRSSYNQAELSAAAKELSAIGADHIDIHDCQEYTHEYQRSSRCMELYRYLVVLSDGRVTPCCVDFDGVLSFGSVIDEPNLGILFNSKPIRELRQALRSSKTMPAICSHCHYRTPQKDGR